MKIIYLLVIIEKQTINQDVLELNWEKGEVGRGVVRHEHPQMPPDSTEVLSTIKDTAIETHFLGMCR